MSPKSTSVKLSYLYRDASNYKNYGEVVFANSPEIELNLIRQIIISNLIDGEFFIAKEWGLPELFFDEPNEDDHGWHEFHSIELTDVVNSEVDIKALLEKLSVIEHSK